VLPAERAADDGTRHRTRPPTSALLKDLIEKHAATGSERGQGASSPTGPLARQVRQGVPHEYRRALKEMAAAQLKEAA
jgi:glutamate synthase (NADPH/NADH) large chain